MRAPLMVHFPWGEGPSAPLAALPASATGTGLREQKKRARSRTSDLRVPPADAEALVGVNPLYEGGHMGLWRTQGPSQAQPPSLFSNCTTLVLTAVRRYLRPLWGHDP